MRKLALALAVALACACGGEPAARKPTINQGPPLAGTSAATVPAEPSVSASEDADSRLAASAPADAGATGGSSTSKVDDRAEAQSAKADEPGPKTIEYLDEANAPTSPYGPGDPLGTGEVNALVPVIGDDPEELEAFRRGHGVDEQPRCASEPDLRLRLTPRVEQGSYEVARLGQIVEAHRAELEFCHSRAASRQPELAGTFTVKLIVNDRGEVQMAAVKNSTLGNAAIESCCAQAVRRWTFPKPPGGGIVIAAIDLAFEARCRTAQAAP